MTSKLEIHADRELRLAGLFDKDSDYGGAVGEAVMALVRVFAAQGHSGGSAQVIRDAFALVANFKTLTPITDDEDEWEPVNPAVLARDSGPMWQNRRQSSCFSYDGGDTYFDVDEPRPDGVDPTMKESAHPNDGPGIETTDEGC